MRRIVALMLVSIMCVLVFTACADTAETSASPDAEQTATEPTEESTAAADDAATETAEATETPMETLASDATESPAVSTAAETADQSGSDAALGMFFDTWAGKFAAITGSEGAQKLGVGGDEDVASLIEQARDWRAHLAGDTATIETTSGDVKISATGSDSFQQASVDWKLSLDALTSGSSPDLLSFTLASAAMVETVAGGDTNGLVQVNDIMSSVLGMLADIKEDIVKGQPVNIGDGQFSVSVDTKSGTMSIVGVPTAD